VNPMAAVRNRKFRFIGCEVLHREVCYLAATGPCRVDVEFLRKGLHDLETADMSARIQQAIDATDADCGYEAILLGYARCNDGLVGVAARDIPLVIPKAHDCITLFFGSRKAYQNYFDEHPGTYYMTTGWVERNETAEGRLDRPAYGTEGVMGKLGLTDSYEQLVAKHGKENADFITETLGDWKKNYSRLLYLEMGVCDEKPYVAEAKRIAAERNWQFELRKGDWSVLEKLLFGRWDEDFLIVRPGEAIIARNDDRILGVDKIS
jgi:hypothetical protein